MISSESYIESPVKSWTNPAPGQVDPSCPNQSRSLLVVHNFLDEQLSVSNNASIILSLISLWETGLIQAESVSGSDAKKMVS